MFNALFLHMPWAGISGSCADCCTLITDAPHIRFTAAGYLAGIVLVMAGTVIVATANVLWPAPALQPGMHGTQLWQHLSSHQGIMHLHDTSLDVTKEVEDTALGVGLTLLSMLLLAGRLVSEEMLLTRSSMHALQVWCPFATVMHRFALHHALAKGISLC